MTGVDREAEAAWQTELLETVREGLAGGRSWREEEAASAALSELERRLK